MRNSDITVMARTIAQVLPEHVKVHCALIEDAQGMLYEQELRHVQGSVSKRVKEFTAGRTCARQVLLQLGVLPCAIPAGTRREPTWPSFVTGSISHDGDHCVASAANKKHISLLGIDLTMCEPLDWDLLPLICTSEDICNASALEKGLSEVDVYKLIFSIKESTYKCLFPVVQEIFHFQDVSIRLDPVQQTASISLLNENLFSSVKVQLKAKYCIAGPYIFSIVWAS